MDVVELAFRHSVLLEISNVLNAYRVAIQERHSGCCLQSSRPPSHCTESKNLVRAEFLLYGNDGKWKLRCCVEVETTGHLTPERTGPDSNHNFS